MAAARASLAGTATLDDALVLVTTASCSAMVAVTGKNPVASDWALALYDAVAAQKRDQNAAACCEGYRTG